MFLRAIPFDIPAGDMRGRGVKKDMQGGMRKIFSGITKKIWGSVKKKKEKYIRTDYLKFKKNAFDQH